MFQYKKSSIFFLCLLLFSPVASWSSRKKYKNDIRRLIDLIKRRNILESDEGIVNIPKSVEDLPEAEAIHPGHTLLQPTFGMLKSSVKYPRKDVGGTAVYGNVKNLGLTYGKSNARVLYTGFRKTNDLIKLLQALNKKSTIRPKKSPNKFVIIELDPTLIKKIRNRNTDYSPAIEYNNNAMEIEDDPNAAYKDTIYTRRQRKPRISDYRDRVSKECSAPKTDVSSDSESSDYEHNPGNPYTVHKDTYKQNWLWNHFMDGNHMNVNPYAPQFNSIGPSGAQLFFGRKWWYFNQDDFKPLG